MLPFITAGGTYQIQLHGLGYAVEMVFLQMQTLKVPWTGDSLGSCNDGHACKAALHAILISSCALIADDAPANRLAAEAMPAEAGSLKKADTGQATQQHDGLPKESDSLPNIV